MPMVPLAQSRGAAIALSVYAGFMAAPRTENVTVQVPELTRRLVAKLRNSRPVFRGKLGNQATADQMDAMDRT
jgi:hypothetical protein